MTTVTDFLDPESVKTWTNYEVESSAHIDRWTVRNEGFRRAAIAEKKIAKLKKQLAAAMAEHESAGRIIHAAENAA